MVYRFPIVLPFLELYQSEIEMLFSAKLFRCHRRQRGDRLKCNERERETKSMENKIKNLINDEYGFHFFWHKFK